MFTRQNINKAMVFIIVFFVVPVYAQNSPVKSFGDVTMEEMKMEFCPYDSTASAMILFDKGEAIMDVNRGSSFKRHIRIKFLKKDVADKWATEEVYFDRETESFSKFKATTYNLVDGKIVKTEIGDDGLFKGKYDKFTNQARFTLPQINDGSIIEYAYMISASELQGIPSWQFQYDVPVLWSEYTMTVPNFFSFRKDWQGFYQPRRETKGDVEKLTMANVPAFKEEPFITSEENYISKLNLYLESYWIPGQMEKKVIKSWGNVAGGVYESDLGIQIRGSGFLKKIVEEQIAGITEPEKQMQTIYDYVKKTISWNDFTDVFPDRQFKEVLEKKSGSSSEVNGILISMLKKADLEADPVLLRTRNKGFLKPFLPVASQFNDVICRVKIGEKVFLLDATNLELPMSVLPKRCINGKGFLITKEAFSWIDLSSPKSRISTSTDFALSEDGSLNGKLTISHDGLYASAMRKDFKKKGETDYVKAFLEGKNWEHSKSSFENIDDYKITAKETHEFSIPEFGQTAGDVIYLNPVVHGRYESNPFKMEKREYPVDYGVPFDEVYFGKITIPTGFEVDEMPKPIAFALPENGGRFTYNISVNGNTIVVVNQLSIAKTSFETEQYLYLREFYTQVVAKQNEQIVLKKKP